MLVEPHFRQVPGRSDKFPVGTTLYKVLWKGWPPEIATWEEENHIPCGEYDFVAEYEARLEEEAALEAAGGGGRARGGGRAGGSATGGGSDTECECG